MISRWGWEQGPEYETKIRRNNFFPCMTAACMSVHIAAVHLVIPSFVVWRLFMVFSATC